jgi:transcriptional regulator GlxA family with amidase domain
MATRTRRIGIIGYDHVQGLDMNGPLDVFSVANSICGRSTPPYEPLVLGVKRGAFRAESGAMFLPHEVLDDVHALDTLIIPGGRGMRELPQVRAKVVRWLHRNVHRVRRVASICTGFYALAESKLLDGKRATTHWRFADEAAARWPSISIDSNAIFVKDGKFYTSAGITAGIDLSLAMVEEDLGNDVALAVARDLVVYLKRSGGQLQYSEPLRHQTDASSDFAEIVAWMLDNLDGDLSVETLAERMNLSTRHFNRKFKSVFGSTPADFVEALRLDEARWLLANNDVAIENLATSVGYSGGDVFRRAFERRFGVVPSEYRARFCG